jgi:predicted O-methyltransferase YrrM
MSSKDVLNLIAELDRLGKTRDDAWQVPLEEGWLLHHIALSTRAKTIVEIGTSYGFSGLFWAMAMQQTAGRLHTIDVDLRKVASSRETFAMAGVADVITQYEGDALAVLKTIPGPYDLVFIDADKPRCRAYFDAVWPKVRSGGAAITDNAVTHRDELKDYIAYLRGRADVLSIEVTVGNGIEWTIKL